MDIQKFFWRSLKREIPQLLPDGEVTLELGPGNSPIPGVTQYLDYPEWNADVSPIPFLDETFDTIHIYNMLEHVINPIRLLIEMERVLKVGGHINVTVPHASCSLAVEDLDHKTFWNEESWRKLFHNDGYEKHAGEHDWQLEVHANFIMGIVQRNLNVHTQLIKVEK